MLVPTPVLADLHPQFEIDLRTHKTLDLLSSRRADRAQHRALFSDDDALLRVALNKYVSTDVGQGLGPLLEFLDDKLGGALRDVASEETMELLGTAAFALEQATLGWSEHSAD